MCVTFATFLFPLGKWAIVKKKKKKCKETRKPNTILTKAIWMLCDAASFSKFLAIKCNHEGIILAFCELNIFRDIAISLQTCVMPSAFSTNKERVVIYRVQAHTMRFRGPVVIWWNATIKLSSTMTGSTVVAGDLLLLIYSNKSEWLQSQTHIPGLLLV